MKHNIVFKFTIKLKPLVMMGRFGFANAVISTRYNTYSLDSLDTLLINLYSASALPM